MCSNYKTEEKQLKNIVYKFVKPISDDHQLDLCLYYKNRKLKNLFIRNKNKTENSSSRDHVVYMYTCNKDGCNSSVDPQQYIGYTTCTLEERFRTHTQIGSIKNHLSTIHNIKRIPKKELLDTTKVLRGCQSKRKLIITEALVIKELKPSLNSQEEGCEKIIKIFKH